PRFITVPCIGGQVHFCISDRTNDDGTIAAPAECITFARLHNLPVFTMEDLFLFRQAHERKASSK
ncbi:hypothetical protein ACVGWF_07700, partial [Enterobacter asburiae]